MWKKRKVILNTVTEADINVIGRYQRKNESRNKQNMRANRMEYKNERSIARRAEERKQI